MREKQPRVIVTFHTTAEAMAMEKLCRERGIAGKLISAPRCISADCGIAWSAPDALFPDIARMVEEGSVEVDGIHRISI